MAREEQAAWSGLEFLACVGGSAKEFSPARVLFLVQRLGATGRLWLTEGADIRTLDFADGGVVACSGFPDLLGSLDIVGEQLDGLAQLVEMAVERGHEESSALEVAAARLGRFIVECEGKPELMVQFAPDAPGPSRSVRMRRTPVDLLALGVQGSPFLVDTRAWWLVEGGATPIISRPADTSEAQWGLSEQAMKLLASADAAAEVRAIAVQGDAEWDALATLRIIGMLRIVAPVAAVPAALAQSPEEAPLDTEEVLKAKLRFDRPHSPGEAQRPVKRKRSRAARNEALARNPWDSPPDLVEDHLKEAYEALGSARPEAALIIRKLADLEPEAVGRRYREACARYHPDRYLGSNQAVRALAEGCFAQISEAYHLLKDATQFQQAKERLEYRETGKRPVNQKSRARSRVDFKRAEMLFRQHRFADAVTAAQRAEQGDPPRWEYRYLRLRSAWHAGTEQTEDVVTGILEIEGMDSHDRGEAVYIAGEMLLKDGRKKEAYGLFKQAVAIDPENVGARRRIRLELSRKTRESDKAGDSKKKGDTKKAGRPLFGGLFKRRGE